MKKRYIMPSVRVLCPDNSDIIAQSVLISNETIDNYAEYVFLGWDDKSSKKDINFWDSGW